MDFAIQIQSDRTIIYQRDRGIVLNEATCIAFTRGDKGKINVFAIGNEAQKIEESEAANIHVTRPIAHGRVTEVAIAQAFFREIYKKIEGVRRPKAVFVIPSSLTEEELLQYKEMIYAAPLHQAQFVPATIPLALELGYDIERSRASLAINITEDACDIVVINGLGIINGGTIEEGGAYMNRLVREYIIQKYDLEVGTRVAREARLATQTLLGGNPISFRMSGIHRATAQIREEIFTCDDARAVLLPVYTKIVKVIRNILVSTNPDIVKDVVDGGVFVGGDSAYLNGLREMLEKELEIKINMSDRGHLAALTGVAKLLDNPTMIKKIVDMN